MTQFDGDGEYIITNNNNNINNNNNNNNNNNKRRSIRGVEKDETEEMKQRSNSHI